jgi:hypothetical protein
MNPRIRNSLFKLSGIFSLNCLLWLLFFLTSDPLFAHNRLLDQIFMIYGLAMISVAFVFFLFWLKNERIQKWGAFLILFIFLISLGFFVRDFIFSLFNHNIVQTEGTYWDSILAFYKAVLLTGSFFVCRFAVKKMNSFKEIILIQNVNFISAVVFLTGSLGHGVVMAPQEDDSSSKHVVLLVVDGMPAWVFRAWNPEIPETESDRFIQEKSIIYKNFRTNRTYTYGFFSTLYHGNLALKPVSKNLWSLLEDGKVSSQWLVSHTNGIPECYLVSGYGGIRSSYCTEPCAKWLRRLHIPAHFRLNSGHGAQESSGSFLTELCKSRTVNAHPWIRKTIDRLVEFLQNQSNWQQSLIESIRYNKHHSNRSFTLCHIFFPGSDIHPEMDCVLSIDAVRQNHLAYGHVIRKQIELFLREIEASHLEKNLVVMIVADHGRIYRNHKIHYGFHCDEDVTHVPFFLIDFKNRGLNEQAFDTQDLQTSILKQFDIVNPLNEQGRSIQDPKAKDRIIPVMTTASSYRKEEFLCLYKDDVKIVYNIYDLSNITVAKRRFHGFEEEDSQCVPVTAQTDSNLDYFLKQIGKKVS